MIDEPTVPAGGRGNGLAPTAPDPDQTILVAGGAGYIGSVLLPRLLERGYRVRLLDRFYFGHQSLEGFEDRLESSSSPTCATSRHGAGRRRRRHQPLGPQQRPDGRVRPRGELADERDRDREPRPHVRRARHRALRLRLVLLAVRRHAARHARRDRADPAARAYATSKRYGEEKLLELADQGLCPVLLRNGTVYGYSPRMRFDLVVNTFVKDALLNGRLMLHGGGWMWRPLVDVRDVSDAMIAAYEAPAEQVKGEIFNVLHSNYQIRELAMLVAGSVQLTGRAVTLEEVPAPKLTRDYECSNAKLSTTLGFIPRHSVLEAVADLVARFEDAQPAQLTDPRNYNIRWLELLNELKPSLETFSTVL